ncbi:MAG: haloacid dehalogenase-like hydrolase [Clostridia bacterium]|nr:haloacid dehalogenase-like hydrolase [Clostridia bacterium]
MNNNIINIFDFDGTLTTETWPKFWVWVKKFGYSGEKRNDNLEEALDKYRSTHSGNALETFFSFFNDLLVENNESITYQELMEGEKYIKYNCGLEDFIKNNTTKNYIVSGGLKEFLQNLEIAKYFDGIYGSSLKHDKNGLIIGIDEVMTDDKKVLAIRDILRKNNIQENNCQNVYFIGDGYSDAPSMRFVHDNGGKAVFVHQENQYDKLFDESNRVYETLNSDGIVDFCCIADYRNNSRLSRILLRQLERDFDR